MLMLLLSRTLPLSMPLICFLTEDWMEMAGKKEKMASLNAAIFWAGVRQNKGESMLGGGFRDISAHAVSRNKGRFQGQA